MPMIHEANNNKIIIMDFSYADISYGNINGIEWNSNVEL